MTNSVQTALENPVKLAWASMFLTTGLLVAAGAIPKFETAAISSGSLVLEERLISMETQNGGQIVELNITEGQEVFQGDVLAVLSNEQIESEYARLRSQYVQLTAEQRRLLAELEQNEDLLLLRSESASPPKDLKQAVERERVTFRQNQDLLAARARDSLQNIQMAETAITGARSELSSLETEIELIEEELAGAQSLYDSGYASKTRLISLKRALAIAGQKKARLQSTISSQIALIEGVRTADEMREAERLVTTEAQRSEVVKHRQIIKQELDRFQKLISSLTVTASADGWVNGVSSLSLGDVISAGEAVLTLVPQRTAYQVSAKLPPHEAMRVEVGQTARIQSQSYGQRFARPVSGTVAAVSPKITQDETGPYFEATISLDDNDLQSMSERYNLRADLPVQVHINTGPTSLLKQILKPVAQLFATGMREP